MKVLVITLLVAAASAVEIWNLDQLENAKKKKETHYVLKNIQVPAGKTLDLQNLPAGSKIEFAGKITFGYKEWKGPMIIVKGERFTVEGKPGHVLDGEGQRWWDVKGGNGGKVKPNFIYCQLTNSKVTGLQIKNTPKHVFAINDCHHTDFLNLRIDNSLGHTKGGHNTDGFDVAKSSHISIQNSYVNNQDDCLAINNGNDILFKNNICEGGHGIAVAVGGYDLNEASNIVIKDCQVIKNNIGIRVKTHKQGKGFVKGVTFDNVVLKDISEVGIVIIGNYLNEGPTGDPNPGIPITNLHINNVRGNVLNNGTAAHVFVAPGTAKGWVWNANVQGGKQVKQTWLKSCKGVPSNVKVPSCN